MIALRRYKNEIEGVRNILPKQDLVANYQAIKDGKLIDSIGVRDGEIFEGYALKGDGTAYVDTGIVPNENSIMRVWGNFTTIVGQQLIGTTGDGVTSRLYFGINSTGQWRLGWGNDGPTGGIADTKRHKFEVNGGKLYVDDIEIISSLATTVTEIDSIYFLATNLNNAPTNIANFNLERAEIVHNGITHTYKVDSTTGTNSDFPYLIDSVGDSHGLINGDLSTSYEVNNDCVSYANEEGYTTGVKINEIDNYKFSDGTNGWVNIASTTIVASRIASNTADGSVNYGQLVTYPKNIQNNQYFIFSKYCVTNSEATLFIEADMGSGNINVGTSIISPTQNQFYESFGTFTSNGANASISIKLTHSYADSTTANGKVMEVDGNVGVYCLNLTKLDQYYPEYNLLTKTADEINAIKEELQAKQLYLDQLATIIIDDGVRIPSYDGTKCCAFYQQGKNLISEDMAYAYNTDGGDETITKLTTSMTAKTYVVLCQPNTEYTISKSKVTDRFRVFWYDAHPIDNVDLLSIGGDYIDRALYTGTFTTSSNAKYLAICVTENSDFPDWVQLELGSIATAYVPYVDIRADLQHRGRVKYNARMIQGVVDNGVDYGNWKDDGVNTHNSEGIYLHEGDGSNSSEIHFNDIKGNTEYLLVLNYKDRSASLSSILHIKMYNNLTGVFQVIVEDISSKSFGEYRNLITTQSIITDDRIRLYLNDVITDSNNYIGLDVAVFEASQFANPLTDPLPILDKLQQGISLIPPKCPALIQADTTHQFFKNGEAQVVSSIVDRPYTLLNPTNSNVSIIPFDILANGLFSLGVEGVEPVNNVLGTNGTAEIELLSTGGSTFHSIDSGMDLTAGKYLLFYNITVAPSTSTRNTPQVVLDDDSTMLESTATDYNTSIGRKVYKIDTAQGIKEVKWWAHTTDVNPKIKEFMLLKVDDTTYNLSDDELLAKYHYVEGFTTTALNYDLVARGKNEFDTETYISQVDNSNYYTANENGGITTTSISDGRAWSDIAKYQLKPNTPYVFTANSPSAVLVQIKNELNNAFVSTDSTDFNYSFTTTSSGAIAIKLDPLNAVSGIELNNIQFEEDKGQTLGVYEPYIQTKTEFSIPSEYPLVELPNVKNVINKDTRNYDVGVKKVVVDGSEDFGELPPLTSVYKFYINNFAINKNVYHPSLDVINATATSNDGDYKIVSNITLSDFRFLGIYSSDKLYISAEKTKVDAMAGATTLDKFKTYLNTYPIALTYQLAIPITLTDGEQGFKAPNQSVAYLDGDLVITPKVGEEDSLTPIVTATLYYDNMLARKEDGQVKQLVMYAKKQVAPALRKILKYLKID